MVPEISVVIPTRNRPLLVLRAVETALAQTFSNIEVVVVVDGPDDATGRTLATIRDGRLTLVILDKSVGGAQARNVGVERARGEWIAFLDDDDEWLPRKLEKQIALGHSKGDTNVCIACKFIERSENGERILPLRDPEPEEPVSEYIYCPKGYSLGEGFIQTSTLLMRRALLLKIPFIQGLGCGQETTWLLRSSKDAGLKLFMVSEALVIFSDDRSRARISTSPKWRTLLTWASNNKQYFTPKAYSFFIATSCVPYALQCKEPTKVFLELLKECMGAKPTLKCLLLFFYRWLMPTQLRRRSGWLLGRTLKTLRGQTA